MRVIYWVLYTWGLIVFAPFRWMFNAVDWFFEGYGKYSVARDRERNRRHAR
jgi:hypothetical protein